LTGNVTTHGFPNLANLEGITNSSFAGAVLVANADGSASWVDPSSVGGSSMWGKYQLNEVDKQGSTTYLGKQEPEEDKWLVVKIVAGTTTVFTYANESNNSGVASFTAAWASRVSLNYGAVGDITLE
jgi:hypothetical protein